MVNHSVKPIPVLRPFQKKGQDQIEREFQFLNRLLYVQPTGTGKTKLLCSLTKKYAEEGKFVLICVHKIELLDQICEDLNEFHVNPGVIAGARDSNRRKQVQVCSIQTLINRDAPPADLIIIDECHHCKSNSYQRIWELYPTAKILGVTATPVRLDGESFEDSFDKLIELYPISWYVKNGYLVESYHHMLVYPKENIFVGEDGDYDTDELERIVISEKYIHNPYLAYKQYSDGKKAIIFCPTIKSSKLIAKYFNEKGIAAAHLDCDVSAKERKRINADFKSGKILVLVNKDIVSEGYDVPDLDVVILARKTKSFSLYMQMIGRVLRPDRFGLKKYGVILDVAGLYAEHKITGGDDVEWSLKGEHKKIDLQVELPGLVAEETGMLQVQPSVSMGIDPSSGDIIPIPIVELSPAKDVPNTQEMIDRMFGFEDVVLVPINGVLKNLVIFEAYLKSAEKKKHKLLSAVFKYRDYLRIQKRALTQKEEKYCDLRLEQLGHPVQKGFWYHLRKDSENEKFAA